MEHNNEHNKEEVNKKYVVMVGDAASGMTCMLMAYNENKTPDFSAYYSRQWEGRRK